MNIAISYKTESEFNTLVRYCDENKIKKEYSIDTWDNYSPRQNYFLIFNKHWYIYLNTSCNKYLSFQQFEQEYLNKTVEIY